MDQTELIIFERHGVRLLHGCYDGGRTWKVSGGGSDFIRHAYSEALREYCIRVGDPVPVFTLGRR